MDRAPCVKRDESGHLCCREVFMRFRFIFASVAAIALIPLTASATEVGVRASSLGLGVEVSQGIAPFVDARVMTGAYTFNADGNAQGLNYTGKAKLSNVAAVADVHVPLTSIRFTGGLLFNSNRVDITGQPSGATYTINGNTYPSVLVGTINGTVKFNGVAPYLGLGYDGTAKHRVGVSFDAGAVFQGSPNVTLTSSNPAPSPQFTTDLQAAQQKAQSNLNYFKIYPVLTVTLAAKL